VSKQRLVDALKNSIESNGHISQAMSKIEKEEKLSSKEFFEIYDSLWREGPTIRYVNPDNRLRDVQAENSV
jgi:hypothetical protein